MVPRLVACALVVLLALAAGQDIRGLGMGRLTLVLESETEPLDMYGFGKNPAGLHRSELPRTPFDDSAAKPHSSVLELYAPGYFYRKGNEQLHEWAIGEPLPSQLQACFPNYMDAWSYGGSWYHFTGDWIPYVPFPSSPSGLSWRYRGKFALAAYGTWSYAAVVGDSPDYAGKISTPELGVTAAVPAGLFDIGLELPFSLTTDTTNWGWSQYATTGFRLGAVFPLRSLELGAVVASTYPYSYMRWSYPFKPGFVSAGTADDYSLQAIVRPADWLRLGAAGGHRRASTGAVFTSPWAGLRAECRPKNLPFLAGFEAEWARLRTHQPTHENDQMDSVGVGAGLGVRLAPLLAGAELHFAQRTYPEDTGAVLKSNLTTNCGAELNLGKTQVRLGFLHSVRPVRIAPGTGFNTYTGTAGFGFDFASLRADVAWNHTYRPVGPEIEDEVHLDIKRGW